MPHNGFIYEARMDMMESSGHCIRAPDKEVVRGKEDAGAGEEVITLLRKWI